MNHLQAHTLTSVPRHNLPLLYFAFHYVWTAGICHVGDNRLDNRLDDLTKSMYSPGESENYTRYSEEPGILSVDGGVIAPWIFRQPHS